jgi:hypothetical protein
MAPCVDAPPGSCPSAPAPPLLHSFAPSLVYVGEACRERARRAYHFEVIRQAHVAEPEVHRRLPRAAKQPPSRAPSCQPFASLVVARGSVRGVAWQDWVSRGAAQRRLNACAV